MTLPWTDHEGWSGAGWDLLGLAIALLALGVGVHMTGGLHWPYDPDHFRDLAFAQTALDGHPLSDPYYTGEWLWYNPLLPWILAAGSAFSRIPLFKFHVVAGPWLNFAGPIAFYLLARRLSDRRSALLGLAFFLFVTSGSEPPWAAATYAPWLFASTFAQAFCYVILIVALRIEERPSARTILFAGALLGLTLLVHTAPAIVGGTVLAHVLARALVRERATKSQVGAAIGLMLLVASPLLWSIGIHYRVELQHTAPLTWPYPPVTWEGLQLLAQAQAWPTVGLALPGLIACFSRPKPRAIIAPWLLISVGLTAYGMARDLHPSWPPLLPTFHFWFYVTALQSLLAGVGASVVIDTITRHRRAWTVGFITATVVFLTVRGLPLVSHRFRQARAFSITRDRHFARATAALRNSTTDRDVVLATGSAAQAVVGPAGRKTVAVDTWFSNPYVRYEPRADARDAMLAALAGQRAASFLELASKYKVSVVLQVGADACNVLAQNRDVLVPIRVEGPVCIYRVRDTPAGHSSASTNHSAKQKRQSTPFADSGIPGNVNPSTSQHGDEPPRQRTGSRDKER